jgi:uncharacterized membrane protein YhhN
VTGTTWALIAAFLALAALDWAAVAAGRRSVEVVAKPFAMVALVGAALALHPVDDAMRGWFVAALALSLAGDVLLLNDRTPAFLGGLAAFLGAHLCYVVGFLLGGVTWWAAAVGLVAVGLTLSPLLPRLLAGAAREDHALVGPVTAYVAVIIGMAATAFGSTVAVAVAGALLFVLSDLVLGWSRFVRGSAWSRLVVMVSYHLGQLLLVLSLVVPR